MNEIYKSVFSFSYIVPSLIFFMVAGTKNPVDSITVHSTFTVKTQVRFSDYNHIWLHGLCKKKKKNPTIWRGDQLNPCNGIIESS